MARFREVQRFPLWAEGLLVLIGVLMPILSVNLGKETWSIWLLAIPASLLLVWVFLFRMVTEVDGEKLTVSFGWVPSYRCTFPLADISAAQKVKYQPIRDYGGWGIRGFPVQCLSAQGDEGVQLELKSGRKMLIGSQQASKLQAVLAKRG
ncbi:MAG: hypothetical protein LCH41_03445 [Armatimonadetes bacterium]|nr:hypothetical protein [Armatimonadota bacterium]